MQLYIRPLIVFVLVCFGQVMAQSRHEKIGDEMYARLAYAKAIPHYKAAVKKSPEDADLTWRLAHCYYLIRDYSAAEAWYTKLVKMDDVPAESYFEYGHVLLQQRRYDEAQAAFDSHNKLNPKDGRAKRFSESLLNRDSWYRDSSAFEIELLPFNTDDSDFGAVSYEDGVVFASSRPVGTPTDLIYEGLNSHFLNLYHVVAKDEESNDWGKPDLLKGDVRTKFHESSFTADSSGNKAFFSRNNFLDGKRGKSNEKTMLLKIYGATMEGIKGKDITEFPFNNDSYSLTHPAISADGLHLYFASDMPGGEGGKDLYVSHFQNGNWTTPENLGNVINTPGNEVFPSPAENGTLFFASDGHPGLGHLDIFETRPGVIDSKVRNIGAPLNSEFDDFAIFWKPGNETGYFSSNRPGGKGDDDIYGFRMELPSLEIFVKDSVSQFPIEDAELVLTDINGKLISALRTDSTGYNSFKVARGNQYRVKINTRDFDDYFLDINTRRESGGSNEMVHGMQYTIALYNPPPAITALVVDEGRKSPLEGAEIVLRPLQSPDSILRESDRYGRFSVKLEPETNYELIVRKEGYFAFKSAISTTLDSFDGDTIIPMKMIPVELEKEVVLNDIHYDFDKWDLRPEAMIELEKLGILLQDNPRISIELGAHTDSRGSDAYNQKLSERRAISAKGFLVVQGIDENRISCVGYGETQPINECKNGVQCSEREHFANRRTVFKITGYEGKIIQKSGLPER